MRNPPDRSLQYERKATRDWARVYALDRGSEVGKIDSNRVEGSRLFKISTLRVDPSYRGRGVGQRLYLELVRAVYRRGAVLTADATRSSDADRARTRVRGLLRERRVAGGYVYRTKRRRRR